jgi:hypothetical protein
LVADVGRAHLIGQREQIADLGGRQQRQGLELRAGRGLALLEQAAASV